MKDGDAPAPQPGESAADMAVRVLRRDITSGAYEAGARLPEVSLAERLGISRTPVREALRRLALEGLVVQEPGLGARVARLSDDETEQIFEIRRLLETYAARRAARFASAQDVLELRTLAMEMTARTPPRSDEDFAALSAANSAFHKTVLRAASSSRLSGMLGLAVDMGLVLRTYRMYTDRDLVRSASHHHELVDAIEARAEDWAASVMAAHLDAAAAVARADAREGIAPSVERAGG